MNNLLYQVDDRPPPITTALLAAFSFWTAGLIADDSAKIKKETEKIEKELNELKAWLMEPVTTPDN